MEGDDTLVTLEEAAQQINTAKLRAGVLQGVPQGVLGVFSRVGEGVSGRIVSAERLLSGALDPSPRVVEEVCACAEASRRRWCLYRRHYRNFAYLGTDLQRWRHLRPTMVPGARRDCLHHP
jgi:hypothetical protein